MAVFQDYPIINAIDIYNKFCFSYGYTRLNSKNSLDFLKWLKLVYPLKNTIHTIQTDNGLEFLGEFDKYLKEKTLSTYLFILAVLKSTHMLKEQTELYKRSLLMIMSIWLWSPLMISTATLLIIFCFTIPKDPITH